MKLVVGLGNPGKEYENTRHNIGYELADMFAKKYNVNSFEEIEDRILTLWEHEHIYDETLLNYL